MDLQQVVNLDHLKLIYRYKLTAQLNLDASIYRINPNFGNSKAMLLKPKDPDVLTKGQVVAQWITFLHRIHKMLLLLFFLNLSN